MAFRKKIQKTLPVETVSKDFLVGEAPVHDVVIGIRKFNP